MLVFWYELCESFLYIFTTAPSIWHKPVTGHFLFSSFGDNWSKHFSKLLFHCDVLELFSNLVKVLFPCFRSGWVLGGCRRDYKRKNSIYQGSTGFRTYLFSYHQEEKIQEFCITNSCLSLRAFSCTLKFASFPLLLDTMWWYISSKTGLHLSDVFLI